MYIKFNFRKSFAFINKSPINLQFYVKCCIILLKKDF